MIRNVFSLLRYPRVAFVTGVAITALMSPSGYAQQPAASPGTQLPESGPGPAAPPAPAAAGEATAERVVVTGSYIPTAEEVTASPLDTLTTAEIQRSGTSDVLAVLQKRNPDFTGGVNLGSSNANISANATQGGSSVQIRGFPTLVLYQGRRVADSSAVAAGGFVFSDTGLFPAALISRIEVLKDGASALYGSEAVGGVVNIFTKDEFQGAEVGFRYGTTVQGAVAERRGYAIAGVGNETTQVTAGMQYLEIDALFARQKDYSAISIGGGSANYSGAVREAGPPNAAGQFTEGRFLPIGLDVVNYPGDVIANSPFDVGVQPGSIPALPTTGNPAAGYSAIPEYYRQAGATEHSNFNLNTIPTSTLDTARTNFLASVNHQVFGKQLELFGNFLYSNSSYQSILNAQPITLGQGLLILGSMRVNPNTGTLIPEDRGAPAPFNPFVQSLDANSQSGPFRLINAMRYQSAPRIFDNDNNFYRFLGGIRSQITEDFLVETAAYYSKYDITFANRNLPILDQVNDAIAGVGDFEGTPLDPFAINPIGTGPGQLPGDVFARIFGTNIRKLSSFQRAFDAKVIGFPFELPGGKLGFSAGVEYRLEGFKADASPEIYLGSVPILDVNEKRDIFSQFVELSVPIIGPSMNVPFAYSLELNGAFRHDEYQGVSEDANVPKVSLRYQPIKDLTLRASYSNSFIAPTLFETQGPNTQGFTGGLDLGFGSEQAAALSGSNPALIPSTAETYTAGMVYSPSFVPGLTLSVDFFRTLQVNIIGTIDSATIIFDVEDLGPGSAFAPFVAFNNFPGQAGARPVTAPGQLAGNLNTVFITTQNQNLGGLRVEGWDLSARYNIDLRTAGQLELGVAAVYFSNYDQKNLPIADEYYNLTGLVGGEGFGAIPDYKLTFLAEYRVFGFTLSLNANYLPELLNTAVEDPAGDQSTFEEVEDYFLLDGRLSYTFVGKTTPGAVVDSKDAKGMMDAKSGAGGAVTGAETMSPIQKLLDGLTLTVGCNNMLDTDPPLLTGANSNTDLSVYDPFGQFVYFEISKKF